MNLVKRAVLPLVLMGVVAVVSTTADAAQDKAPRDPADIRADIVTGRAKKLPTPPEQVNRTSAWWNGCKFVYIPTKTYTYETPYGEKAHMTEDPGPMPPKEPGCVDRPPTEQEINAMRGKLNADNAKARPPGAESRPLPDLPPSRNGKPLASRISPESTDWRWRADENRIGG